MSSATAPSLSAASAFDGSNAPRLTSVPPTGPGPVAGGPRHDLTELPDGIEVQRAVSKGRKCPVGRDQFAAAAGLLSLTIGTTSGALTAEPRVFSGGSYGWYINGKAPVMVGKTSVMVQFGGNMVVCKSKGEDPQPFLDHAVTMFVAVGTVAGGQPVVGEPRDFQSRSFGWYLNGKVMVVVNGTPLVVQCGINCTVIGSKDAD